MPTPTFAYGRCPNDPGGPKVCSCPACVERRYAISRVAFRTQGCYDEADRLAIQSDYDRVGSYRRYEIGE